MLRAQRGDERNVLASTTPVVNAHTSPRNGINCSNNAPAEACKTNAKKFLSFTFNPVIAENVKAIFKEEDVNIAWSREMTQRNLCQR